MSMIDIVVVAHTDHRVLEGTLKSITAQTSAATMVVVDIGHAGTTRGKDSPLLQQLMDTDQCRVLALPGANRYAAINQGLAMCKGSYLMVLHEGDKLADPHVLADCEHQLRADAAPDVLYGERIKYIGPHWYHKKPRRHEQVALGMFVELSCMLIRRALFEHTAFDDSYQEAGDYAFVCQLLHEHPHARWQATNRVLCCVVLDRMHEGHLATKLREDWRVQRRWVGSGLALRCSVFLTRLVSQLLRKLTRLMLGYPGYQSGALPMDHEGRIAM